MSRIVTMLDVPEWGYARKRPPKSSLTSRYPLFQLTSFFPQLSSFFSSSLNRSTNFPLKKSVNPRLHQLANTQNMPLTSPKK